MAEADVDVPRFEISSRLVTSSVFLHICVVCGGTSEWHSAMHPERSARVEKSLIVQYI
jgi:hypothetical protein